MIQMRKSCVWRFNAIPSCQISSWMSSPVEIPSTFLPAQVRAVMIDARTLGGEKGKPQISTIIRGVRPLKYGESRRQLNTSTERCY